MLYTIKLSKSGFRNPQPQHKKKKKIKATSEVALIFEDTKKNHMGKPNAKGKQKCN